MRELTEIATMHTFANLHIMNGTQLTYGSYCINAILVILCRKMMKLVEIAAMCTFSDLHTVHSTNLTCGSYCIKSILG